MSSAKGTAHSLATDGASELSNSSLQLNPKLYSLQAVRGVEQIESAAVVPVQKKQGRSQSFDGG